MGGRKRVREGWKGGLKLELVSKDLGLLNAV